MAYSAEAAISAAKAGQNYNLKFKSLHFALSFYTLRFTF